MILIFDLYLIDVLWALYLLCYILSAPTLG